MPKDTIVFFRCPHASDLTELLALLFKHDVPLGVSVRLVHKHLDVCDGEAMAFKSNRPLHGLNYFVDSDGMPLAYEYTTDDTMDMAPYTSFLTEFCRLVTQKGLQMKFGLKLSTKEDATAATEFEYPHLRSTIIIP
ncbi:Ff.00g035830.m01.CDS01 [Fusarium sp. VM40]|nr:Ff.00g035830.m01.CDS01 [Fusarium sp. VM40]